MQAKGPIVVIAGTRPEAIKMMPIYLMLQQQKLPVFLCATMQHDQLLYDVFNLFGVTPDIDLGVMRINQDLFYITQSLLQKSKELYQCINPSLVLVQGDTTSTMACALAAFYLGIPIGHIEAGLRTYDIFAPFPEESNRRFVSAMASMHFTPTQQATACLMAEGINAEHIYCTGNTVVDALRITKDAINNGTMHISAQLKQQVAQCKTAKIILFTMHRRESFNGGLMQVLQTLVTFLKEYPDIYCFYPYHPNPHVIHALNQVGLTQLPNCFLSEPLAYHDVVYLLDRADLVVTDSGGIQEEAVSLGKQVLVLREKSERQEGIAAGLAHLVGNDVHMLKKYLTHYISESIMYKPSAVYGDGYAAERIVTIIQKKMSNTLIAACVDKQPIVIKKHYEDSMKKIAVLGLGYIGLPTSIVLADAGCDVVGIDIDAQRVLAINQGDPIIQEPDLFEKLHIALETGRFKVSLEMQQADYFIIAVPTPFKENKRADLSYVFNAAASIARVIKKGDVVILESTVPVGATQMLADYLHEKTGLSLQQDIFVAHCPERVLPGKIFKELIHNDRVIGGITQEAAYKARELYQQFAQGKIYITDSKTAEMVKLIENSSRDVQIAFAHQVASMADSAGLNPYEVIELANKHPRVNILKPSAGVGGHCIAVDPWFLIETFAHESKLLQAARQVNDTRPLEIITQVYKTINQWCKEQHRVCNVLVMGLTYKPDIDDIRESAAIRIADLLQEHQSINLLLCEPHLNYKKMQAMYPERAVSISQGLQQADVVIFLVEHTRFKAIDKKLLEGKIVLDFCGVLQETKENDNYLYWPACSSIPFVVQSAQLSTSHYTELL